MKKTGKQTKNYALLTKKALMKLNQTATNGEIANILNCSKKTVRKSIKKLVQDGEPIATFYGYGGGHKYTKSIIDHQHCIDVSKHVTETLESRNNILVRNINMISKNSKIDKAK